MSTSTYYTDFYTRYFYEGYAGVTFFFILSGFILAHSYQQRLKSHNVGLVDFYIVRIARIYPLHWLTLGIAIYYMHKSFGNWDFFSLKSFLLNASLLHAFFNDLNIMNSYNMVSWSLSVEIFFYALFPLFIALRTRTLIVLLAIIVTATLIWLPVRLPFVSFHLPMYTDQWKYYAYFYPPCRLGDFLAGIVLYRAWASRESWGVLPASFLQLATLATLAAFMLHYQSVNAIYRQDYYYALPMMLVIYAFAHHSGVFARLISNPILVTLGEASFAFYMIHQLVIRFIAYDVSSRFPDLLSIYFNTPEGNFFICFSISTLLSLLLFFAFERPAKRYGITLLQWLRLKRI